MPENEQARVRTGPRILVGAAKETLREIWESMASWLQHPVWYINHDWPGRKAKSYFLPACWAVFTPSHLKWQKQRKWELPIPQEQGPEVVRLLRLVVKAGMSIQTQYPMNKGRMLAWQTHSTTYQLFRVSEVPWGPGLSFLICKMDSTVITMTLACYLTAFASNVPIQWSVLFHP